MKQLFIQSILLFLSFLAVWIWQQTTLHEYTAPLVGVLTCIYIVSTIQKGQKTKRNTKMLLNAILLNTCILLLIFSTGGLQSALFFLFYFLSFSISVMLLPETVFVFALLVICAFLPESIHGNILSNTIKLASFLLICPLAYFFGKAINTKETDEKTIISKENKKLLAAEQIRKDVAEIVQNEGNDLKEKDVEKLQDIVKQTREITQTTILVLTSALVWLSIPQNTQALTMSNDDYMIHMSNLNTASGNIENSKHKIQTSVGETAPGYSTGKNYKVKAGFEYTHPAGPFSFSIAQTIIDFGELTATNPVSRTTVLSISNPPPTGYRVLAYENHTLLAPNNTAIPDTSCDNGIGNEKIAAAWQSTLTYGFGYRCDNLDENNCAGGFEDITFYKQFADVSKNEEMQPVMKGAKIYEKAKSQITYKANVSGTQMPGIYINTITYIATPGF